MYIKRKLEAKILKYLDSPEIIAVVGSRQCGKSTMLMKIFEGLENTAMVSFEDRTALTLFDRNIDDFVDVYVKNKKFLFIDEKFLVFDVHIDKIIDIPIKQSKRRPVFETHHGRIFQSLKNFHQHGRFPALARPDNSDNFRGIQILENLGL